MAADALAVAEADWYAILRCCLADVQLPEVEAD
jgi:hypothetical protein